MAAHKTNSLLKYGVAVVVIIILIAAFSGKHSSQENTKPLFADKKMKNTASNDSAAESLDTLTAELSTTKQHVEQITKDNAQLKQQNNNLLSKLQGAEESSTAALKAEMDQLKNQIQGQRQKPNDYLIGTADGSPQAITTVPDLTQPLKENKANNPFNIFRGSNTPSVSVNTAIDDKKSKPIPYYTIPPNATAVHDRLMIALVGRIPVKGVVTDPYPFKIVFSDDTLAANGLRIPHLQQMIISGYSEGDLNLRSVRGWVTSLTFVFNDGTIATATSNNNDIGHFTKENALGYLSDKWGNPFLRGSIITNAPAHLGGNILLGAVQGAASAYSQAQTTTQNSSLGSNSSVTGSPGKFILGQSGVSATNQAQQWWHDREEQSFDAIYVPTVQPNGEFTEIAVNFTKEIDIDYNLQGRKIAYANTRHTTINRSLD